MRDPCPHLLARSWLDFGLWTLDSEKRYRCFHQRFDTLAVDRAHGKDLVETQFGEFGCGGFGPVRVHLVDGDQHRFAAVAQARGCFAVQRHDALLDVHHKDDDVSCFDRELHLFERRLYDDIIRLFPAEQADAASIYEREGLPAPFHLGADAVARDARLIVHDSDAPTGDAIEQGGLADIGPADNGNQSGHDSTCLARVTRLAAASIAFMAGNGTRELALEP